VGVASLCSLVAGGSMATWQCPLCECVITLNRHTVEDRRMRHVKSCHINGQHECDTCQVRFSKRRKLQVPPQPLEPRFLTGPLLAGTLCYGGSPGVPHRRAAFPSSWCRRRCLRHHPSAVARPWLWLGLQRHGALRGVYSPVRVTEVHVGHLTFACRAADHNRPKSTVRTHLSPPTLP
jgi:hypothetical protein